MSTKSITLFFTLLLATSIQAGKIIDRPKSRFGLTFQNCLGSQSVDLFELECGGSSSISFGGGFVGTYFYGYEFSNHFDLSASVGIQKSYMKPLVNDVDISFTSTRISITPAYIIPIKDGSRMRIKVGAGLDLSIFNELEIEMDDLEEGISDTWEYDRAIGYHLNAIYEVNASRRWAFSGGVQYNGISYSFNSGSKTYPLDSDLKSPNGNAISIVFGAYYCF